MNPPFIVHRLQLTIYREALIFFEFMSHGAVLQSLRIRAWHFILLTKKEKLQVYNFQKVEYNE